MSSSLVRVAFENGDDGYSRRDRDASEENLSSTPSPTAETGKRHADADQTYRKDFFTLNHTTVEVMLDNNLLTWADVSSAGRRFE